MNGFQQWSARHPVAFWVSLVSLAIVLGWAVSGGGVFLAAAVVSGLVWQYKARAQFPEVAMRGARGRIVSSRRSARTVALPPLLLPSGPHVLLPQGQKIQVSKEGHHLDQLGEILVDAQVRHTTATLHRMPPASSRSTKERVQVRIEDTPVGELTPYMGEHFLPLIRVCDERGITVVCRASVKGNQLTADVVLDATKAVALGDDWIDEHVLGTRRH